MIKRIAITLLCLFLVVLVSYCLLGVVVEHSGAGSRYEALKDHGSLIAGLIGFGGVLMLIWHQDKTTKEIIESNVRVMKNEALEIKKNKAIEWADEIGSKINLIRSSGNNGFYGRVQALGQNVFIDTKRSMYQLESFFRAYSNDGHDAFEGIIATECILEFCKIYESEVWSNFHARGALYIMEPMLASLVNLSSLDGFAFKTSSNVIYQFYDQKEKRFTCVNDPEIVYANFKNLTSDDLGNFIIQQMSAVVVPTVINSIHQLRAK